MEKKKNVLLLLGLPLPLRSGSVRRRGFRLRTLDETVFGDIVVVVFVRLLVSFVGHIFVNLDLHSLAVNADDHTSSHLEGFFQIGRGTCSGKFLWNLAQILSLMEGDRMLLRVVSEKYT